MTTTFKSIIDVINFITKSGGNLDIKQLKGFENGRITQRSIRIDDGIFEIYKTVCNLNDTNSAERVREIVMKDLKEQMMVLKKRYKVNPDGTLEDRK